MKVHLITIGLLGLTSFLPGVHSKVSLLLIFINIRCAFALSISL